MRLLLFTILLFSKTAFATNYWVSTSGTNTGTSTSANPWSTAKYLASKNVVAAGDSVFFKAGDVFNLPMPVTSNSGTSGARIYYGRYGTGAKPIFNTLQTITGWTLYSGNIYYATVDVPKLQIVTVDGALKGMGRYPKTGYLTIESHNGLSSLTAPSVSSIPGDPAGAEVVIKKYRYVIDRHPVISRSGNTLNIGTSSDFGPNGSNPINDLNGYFIQSYLPAVTQLGDWYYDTALNRLYMHFGSGNSTSHTIQASLVDEAVSVQARSYITLDNLDFRGGNAATVNALYSAFINVTNCNVTLGTEGIWAANGGAINSTNHTYSGNYIANEYSNGINTIDVDNVTATYNTIRDIHLVPGMGRSGDGIGSGMSITGGNGRVLSNNQVYNVGYCGIAEYTSASGGGNQTFIENNIIDTFSVNKDDAGGLYMYGGKSERSFFNRQMRNNWVKHGIGNIEGVGPGIATAKFACGIYLDEFSNYVNIENNLVTDNSGAGIFLHSTHHDTVYNNVVFNNGFESLLIISYGTSRVPTKTVSDLYVHDNRFIAKVAGQKLVNFEMYNNPSNIGAMGIFRDNTLYDPFGDKSYFRVDDRSTNSSIVTTYTLAGWQGAYNKEQGSINSTVPIASPNDFRVEYNNSPSTFVVPLNAMYRDVQNAPYSSAISLPPYRGEVLLFDSPLPTGTPSWFEIRFRKVNGR